MTSPEPDSVDEASSESFPASDPPSWEPLHPGAPDEHPEHPEHPERPEPKPPEPPTHRTSTDFGGTIPEFDVDLARRLEMPAEARVLELATA